LSLAQAHAVRAAFAGLGPRLREQPLVDFSGLRQGAQAYCEVAPRRPEEVADMVRAAHARGLPLRVRAQGHSLNGASLPAANELLLSTRNLRQVRFEAPGTVTAGAGVVLWILQHFLRRRGFDLPVLNDGYPGPTVGGYLAAGGFGPRSAQHGGFWDNVLEVRLVDGRGEPLRLGRDDARFLWLFGAMGQLGVVVEARLAIVPLPGAGAYPLGEASSVPELALPKIPQEYSVGENESLFWFTLFVPDERLEEAHAGLRELEQRHRGALRFQERYDYPILCRRRMPPLLYPEARAITATGAWGWLSDKSEGGTGRLRAFDEDFMALAASRPWYRRYVQSELASGPDTYARCFGPQTYAGFRELKAELDPRGLLNRASVFPGPRG
jgi:FAD/FMN-containing dehydrogenase